MKTEDDVRALEKLITQLAGMHGEITQLVRKSPNDALNKFKLSLVNKVLVDANDILLGEYIPFHGFKGFDVDELPTNSDAAMVLSQYIDQAERYRSSNVTLSEYSWWYWVDGKKSKMAAKPPTQVGGNNK